MFEHALVKKEKIKKKLIFEKTQARVRDKKFSLRKCKKIIS